MKPQRYIENPPKIGSSLYGPICGCLVPPAVGKGAFELAAISFTGACEAPRDENTRPGPPKYPKEWSFMPKNSGHLADRSKEYLAISLGTLEVPVRSGIWREGQHAYS